MFERFGRDIRRVALLHAEREADALGAPAIGAEHLLLAAALTRPDDGPGPVLARAGLDAASLRASLEQELVDALAPLGIPGDAVEAVGPAAPTGRRMRFSPTAKRSLENAAKVAVERGERLIDTRHLVLGVLRTPSPAVQRLLDRAGADRDALARAL